MGKNKFKNIVWLSDIDTIMEVYELALKHGKKTGDNIQEEFEEVMKKYPEKFKSLGGTNKDVDLVAGDLREEGLKILNLKELDRRKKDE